MSVKKYRFVSPGVFVNEIDNSQIPASPAGIGPVVIGRAEKGPSLRPVTVSSFEEFVNVFGTPAPGGAGDDVWREGTDKSAPTYGAYAAQAYLKNSSPLTYIRLLGAQTTADGGPSAGSIGEAGWEKTNAYGLYVFHDTTGSNELTGALAAIWYCNSGTTVALSGAAVVSSSTDGVAELGIGAPSFTGSHIVLADTGTDFEFKIQITNASGSDDANSTFTANFTEGDSRYIRKVFNTNPQRTNAAVASPGTALQYFLGETFDRHMKANVTSTLIAASATGRTLGSIVKIQGGTGGTVKGSDFAGHSAQSAQSPSIISCRLSPTDGPESLFAIHALQEPGDWTNRNIKVSIQDIQRAPTNAYRYGTFSVVVRQLSDSDNTVRVIEQFDNCDLNPDSLNYVARKVGDQYTDWSEDERRYVQKGDWANNSAYIRVAMDSNVDAGMANPSLLPFGYRGIVKYDDEELTNASSGDGNWATGSMVAADFPATRAVTGQWTSGSLFAMYSVLNGAVWNVTNTIAIKALYPTPELRVSASDGNLSNKTDAYFGFQTAQSAGSTVFDKSTIDLLRPRGGIVGNIFAASTGTKTERSLEFTLDDVSGSGVWVSGSHNAAIGNYQGGSLTRADGAVSGVLDAGFDRFSVPLYGGFDGVNIAEMDPFNSATRVIPTTATDQTSYVFNTYRRTIDAISDPEVIEMNLATIPGLRNEGLTTNLVRTCEDRADALAIIDLAEGFVPRAESNASAATRRQNTSSEIRATVNAMRSRGLNSSYGCAYYPWVRGRDTLNGAFVWLPPSIPALGTLSSSQRKTQVWFAPAGFNRGGLTEGSAGIPVVDVAHQLRRKDRDDLYAANVNPIAKFPAEGIVIFGQKTLQVTPSALDRINVRRLMIFVKKRISQMAANLLFDPNVQVTWDRFTSKVNPFLQSVKTNFGLSDFKVILDDTTTTPELVDRNIMYAKIFLKPTRAIEFIAIDFNITRTGAAFED
jgi:hypothetical protein